jgi:hypothetical protein
MSEPTRGLLQPSTVPCLSRQGPRPTEGDVPPFRHQLLYEPSPAGSGRLGCGSLRYLCETVKGLEHIALARSGEAREERVNNLRI